MFDKEAAERLSNCLYRMSRDNSFWGFFFSWIGKRQRKINTIMSLSLTSSGDFFLNYNPELFDGTSEETLIKILEHEGIHLINRHLQRYLKIKQVDIIQKNNISQKIKKEVFGIAVDCSANDLIKIPKKLIVNGEDVLPIFPGTINMPSDKAYEYYYYEILKKIKKKNPDEMKKSNIQLLSCSTCKHNLNNKEKQKSDEQNENENDSCSSEENSNNKEKQKSDEQNNPCEKCYTLRIDPDEGNLIGSHDTWDDILKETPDILSAVSKSDLVLTDILKNTIKLFKNNQRGNIPGYLQEIIDEILGTPRLPYYMIIRKFVVGSRRAKYRNSSTKINKKRTYTFQLKNNNSLLPEISPFPGKTLDTSFKIGILIDTSGSMSKEEILEGLSAIKSIIEKDKDCKIWVIENDTTIQKEYQIKKLTDIQFNIKGRGGTTLFPGLKRMKELSLDVVIGFTDGYCENLNKIPRKELPKKIIWVLNSNGNSSSLNKTGVVIKY